jgi:hypothetical protein
VQDVQKPACRVHQVLGPSLRALILFGSVLLIRQDHNRARLRKRHACRRRLAAAAVVF